MKPNEGGDLAQVLLIHNTCESNLEKHSEYS